jgi:PhnB protein
MAVNPVPEGLHTITPFFHVAGAARFIEFVRQAFGAEETYRANAEDGSVMHASVRIGDSTIELADANDAFPAMACAVHLYVPDSDAVYERAIAAGATSIREPMNQFYGDREGSVRDPFGNNWYIATHVEDVSDEEMERRMKEYMSQQS